LIISIGGFFYLKYIAAQWLRRRALTPYPDCPGRASSILYFRFSFGRINGDAAAEENQEHVNPKGFWIRKSKRKEQNNG